MLPIIASLQSAAAKTGVGVQRRFHLLWLLVIIVLMVIVGLVALDTARSGKSTSTVRPEQQVQTAPEVSPSAQTQEKIVLPLLEIGDWKVIAVTRSAVDVAFPWEKSQFTSWPFVQEHLNFHLQEAVAGYGDGTVFFLWDAGIKPKFYLTPDGGQTWYHTPRLQGASPGAAHLEEDTVVLLKTRETEPWVNEYSTVKIPLHKFKELRP